MGAAAWAVSASRWRAARYGKRALPYGLPLAALQAWRALLARHRDRVLVSCNVAPPARTASVIGGDNKNAKASARHRTAPRGEHTASHPCSAPTRATQAIATSMDGMGHFKPLVTFEQDREERIAHSRRRCSHPRCPAVVVGLSLYESTFLFFAQEAVAAVMASLLVHDLRNAEAPASPATAAEHASDFMQAQAFHGGSYRSAHRGSNAPCPAPS